MNDPRTYCAGNIISKERKRSECILNGEPCKYDFRECANYLKYFYEIKKNNLYERKF